MSSKLYPTMSDDSFDNRAQKIVEDNAERPVDKRYSKMLAQQATEKTDAQVSRELGWKRATAQDLNSLKRFTGMSGRYDYKPDDPNDPAAGGYIRTRESKEGLNENTMKMASKHFGKAVKGY